jgi:citronellyl-CoA synthetase
LVYLFSFHSLTDSLKSAILSAPNNIVSMPVQESKRLRIKEVVPGFLSRWTDIPTMAISGISTLLMRDHDVKNIAQVLEANAVKYGNRPAVYFEDTILTHTAFNDLSNQYARYLKSIGVEEGDVVILFLDNRLETLIITTALAKIGAVASLINSNQRSKVLLHSINMKHSGFFAVGVELVDVFEEILPDIDHVRKPVLIGITDGENDVLPEKYLDINNEARYESARNLEGARKLKAGTPFAYIFTSGTTGMPKASIQTHRKWLTCVNWFGRINMNLNAKDVIYLSIPLFHSNALLVGWSCAAANGAAMAIRRKFSVTEFWKDVRKYNVSAFVYIGDICRYLMNAPEAPTDRQHRVRKVVGNGLRPDIWDAFKQRFGIEEVYEFYASSEGNLSFTNTLNANATVGWCASKYAIVEYDMEEEVPIRGRNGYMTKVGVGEVGLMLSQINERFPFPGYVKGEDNERKVYRNVFEKGDLWFNTGDLMRDIGLWHAQFVDRLGDTFRWKGENVATAEVEEIINAFPAVSTSAVYGVLIPKTDGRAGMAAIQVKGRRDDFDWKAFTTHLRTELPSYAVPVFVRIQDGFEMTATFKIKKSELKKEGYQPADAGIQLYYLCQGAESYQPFTELVLQSIEKGELQRRL